MSSWATTTVPLLGGGKSTHASDDTPVFAGEIHTIQTQDDHDGEGNWVFEPGMLAIVILLAAVTGFYVYVVAGIQQMYTASNWALVAVLLLFYLLVFRVRSWRIPRDDYLKIDVGATCMEAVRVPAFVSSVLVVAMAIAAAISHAVAYTYKSDASDDLATVFTATVVAIAAAVIAARSFKELPYRSRRGYGRIIAVCSCFGWFLLAVFVGFATWNAAAYANDLRLYPAPGTLYTVQGHLMHMHCEGEGSPPVIFEHGWGSSSTAWAWIFPEVAKTTKACVYDHSGYAWSQIGARPRTSEQIASELHDLLKAADITGPFVFVGHSFAGYNMRYYISKHPKRVKGMVMCDCVNPNSTKEEGFGLSYRCPVVFDIARNTIGYGVVRLGAPETPEMKEIVQGLPKASRAPYTANVLKSKYFQTRCEEWESWPVSTELVMDIEHKTLDMPLRVLSAGDGIYKDHQEYAHELAALSERSTFVLVEGSKHSELLAKEKYATIVTSNVLELLAEVRNTTQAG